MYGTPGLNPFGAVRYRRLALSGLAAAALALAAPTSAQDPDPGRVDWSLVDTIVERIQLPEIPRRDYRPEDFGGTADGQSDARPAILAAIGKASQEGSGRVVLSEGVWLSRGPVMLQSRIELHLEEGATLLKEGDRPSSPTARLRKNTLTEREVP